MNTSKTTVGILSRRTPDDLARLFGPPTGFFEECCRAAEWLGLRVVVFDADDIHPETDTVTPATLIKSVWRECGAEPWPQVVYDRAPVSDLAYSPKADQVRARLVQAQIPFINPLEIIRFAADKWATFRGLSNYDVLLPDTDCLTVTSLQTFLDRYGHVYIKPISGSLGSNIIEIISMQNHTWVVRMDDACHRVTQRRAVGDTVRSLLGNQDLGDSVYLVQQGISAEAIAHRRWPRFDLRVLMQQDEQKQWGMTGLVARVCQTDIPTTNLSTGARSEEAEPILDEIYGVSQRQAILDRVARMSMTICQGLEQDLCAFGELGLDIIPGPKGEPWLIEINAKPGRNVFKRIANSEDVTDQVRKRFKHVRQQAVTLPFRYALGLTSNLVAN
jgi:glutathione synthase/RimK-type ligase-like ATP-grasp enzyme